MQLRYDEGTEDEERNSKKDDSEERREGFNPNTNHRMHSDEDSQKGKKANKDTKEFIQDNKQLAKWLFLGLGQALIILDIVLYLIMAGKIPQANAKTMVISWVIAFFVGYFFLNIAKIALVAVFTPGIVAEEETNQGKVGLCSKILEFILVP